VSGSQFPALPSVALEQARRQDAEERQFIDFLVSSTNLLDESESPASTDSSSTPSYSDYIANSEKGTSSTPSSAVDSSFSDQRNMATETDAKQYNAQTRLASNWSQTGQGPFTVDSGGGMVPNFDKNMTAYPQFPSNLPSAYGYAWPPPSQYSMHTNAFPQNMSSLYDAQELHKTAILQAGYPALPDLLPQYFQQPAINVAPYSQSNIQSIPSQTKGDFQRQPSSKAASTSYTMQPSPPQPSFADPAAINRPSMTPRTRSNPSVHQIQHLNGEQGLGPSSALPPSVFDDFLRQMESSSSSPHSMAVSQDPQYPSSSQTGFPIPNLSQNMPWGSAYMQSPAASAYNTPLSSAAPSRRPSASLAVSACGVPYPSVGSLAMTELNPYPSLSAVLGGSDPLIEQMWQLYGGTTPVPEGVTMENLSWRLRDIQLSHAISQVVSEASTQATEIQMPTSKVQDAEAIEATTTRSEPGDGQGVGVVVPAVEEESRGRKPARTAGNTPEDSTGSASTPSSTKEYVTLALQDFYELHLTLTIV